MSKEYIERDEVIERIRFYCLDCESMKRYGDACCKSCGIGDALYIIDDQPAADVVEVVRCKDCRFRSPKYDEPDGYYGCDLKLLAIDLDCFCSEGERIENGDK